VKTDHDTIAVQLDFDRLVIDKAILIKNIYYDFDKWAIRPDAAIELDKLIVTLNQNPRIQIELGSHTDSRGSVTYNEFLSQKRAESAVTYIISRGINPKRLTAKGYGESMLVNRCKDGVVCTDAEHQENRRTEFKVTSVKKLGKNKKNTEEVFPNVETRPKYYTVELDDTLYRIALMYNTTVDKLKELNNLKDNTIIVGQKLTIY
jgi:LysM repeat protein